VSCCIEAREMVSVTS